jgi:2,5-dihydroxypyridine 5,6-dioxygenase
VKIDAAIASGAGPDTRIRQAAFHLVRHCGSLKAGERVAVVCDSSTRMLAELLADEARTLAGSVELIEIPDLGSHGREPAAEASAQMKAADLAIGITRYSMAHTQARLIAARAGTRYLSMPDYSLALFTDDCILSDYRAARPLVKRFADAFTNGDTVRVQTALGTDITMHTGGRVGNACPGYVELPGELGSPPDIEANISPLESRSNGIVVIDGSIPCPEIGLLRQPVRLTVVDGMITDIGGAPETVSLLEQMFAEAGSPKARILAECGVGLNEKARLTGVMLSDEGALGTMHFGFGSNATVGGVNEVSFHLDFVFRDPSLSVDGIALLDEGKIVPQ